MYARRFFAILTILIGLGTSAAFAGPPPFCFKTINGHPVFSAPPSLTSYYPNTSAVAYPGSLVLAVGQNFGPEPGTLIMHIQDFSTGADRKTQLTIAYWSDTVIVANIPNTITGVVAQTVSFEIMNICNQSDLPACTPAPDAPCLPNPWQISFIPTMDMQVIPTADLSCSMTSNNSGDSCMSAQAQFPTECFGLTVAVIGYNFSPGTFFGIHYSGWGGGNHGTDNFTANVHHTWTVESLNSFSWYEANGSNHTSASLSYPGSGLVWSVPWSEDSCTYLTYSGTATITGPIDVPF